MLHNNSSLMLFCCVLLGTLAPLLRVCVGLLLLLLVGWWTAQQAVQICVPHRTAAAAQQPQSW